MEVEGEGMWWAHLDTLALILTPKHDALKSLDPLVAANLAVGAEVPLLLGGQDFEVGRVI